MIEVLDAGAYRPISLELWNDPKPVAVELEAGDILVDAVNICVKEPTGKKRWGWRYTILRRVKEEAKNDV